MARGYSDLEDAPRKMSSVEYKYFTTYLYVNIYIYIHGLNPPRISNILVQIYLYIICIMQQLPARAWHTDSHSSPPRQNDLWKNYPQSDSFSLMRLILMQLRINHQNSPRRPRTSKAMGTDNFDACHAGLAVIPPAAKRQPTVG